MKRESLLWHTAILTVPACTSSERMKPGTASPHHIRNGQISAVSDICTHQHFSMSLGDLLPDGSLQCAWHGARYDCQTGEVKQVPATSPLPVFQVRLEGDMVLVGPRCERTGAKYAASTVRVK